jgi:hypothetical protein
MAQYYVSGQVGRNGQFEEVARGIHREEYEQALALACELGLRLTRAASGRDTAWSSQAKPLRRYRLAPSGGVLRQAPEKLCGFDEVG